MSVDAAEPNATTMVNSCCGAGEATIDRFQRIQQLRGSITAIVTPMKQCSISNFSTIRKGSDSRGAEDGRDETATETHTRIADTATLVNAACAAQPIIDFQALERLIKFQLENGTQGITVMGTTGENPTVSEDEFKSVIEATLRIVQEVDGNIPVIAGTGTNCTRTTIQRTKVAELLGVDAAMVVTPYYNKPTEEGIMLHYSAVAAACPDLPLIVYNVPARTGCDIKPPLVARLAREIPSIVAVKEAAGQAERYTELGKLCPPEFKIFSGDDDQVVNSIIAGANVAGIISVSANVVPAAIQQSVELALQKNKTKAQELDRILKPLHKAIFVESNPIAVKHILATEMKLIPGGIRLPLTGLSEQNASLVHEAFYQASQQLAQAGVASIIRTE